MNRRDLLDQLGPTAASAAAVMLTSLALAPTLGDGPWMLAAFAVVFTVALVGLALRSLVWPGWLVTVAQGIALVLVITWIYASEVARLGVIPDAAVWSVFATLVNDGTDVINEEIAPITVTTGVQFLVVIGVAAVAWIVDAVAVTWRQATVAGVPLLALYLVPAIVLPDGVPWPLFLLAGAGWLLLLLTDGRRELLRWGRPMDSSSSGRLHSVGGTGRRLGAAALTIAVIVPVVLPSLDDGRFGMGQGDEGEDGDNGASGDGDTDPSALPILTLNPITDLRRDLTRGEDDLAFGYATAVDQPEYFRVATLDNFNGGTWTLEELGAPDDQQASAGLPQPPGLSEETVTQTTAQYDVTIAALESPRLPLPYPVERVDIEGDWRWDADTFDVFTAEEEGSTLGRQYTATHRVISPTAEQLETAGDPQDIDLSLTDVPDDTEDVLSQPTLDVTRGALNDYDKALLIQNWFRTEFTYSLDTVKGNSTDALESFLNDRSGYCEQFAATMALMARVAGIPSRVAVGFTPGEELEEDLWVVTAHDSHAWPELWFEDVGWVRFEPTPGGGDGGATPAYAPAPESDTQGGGGGGGSNTEPNLRRQPGDQGPAGREALRELREFNRGAQGAAADIGVSGGGSENSSGSRLWLWLSLVVIAVGAAAAPATALLARRRGRWRAISTSREAVEAAWADVLDAATDVDLRAQPTETPRDVAARLPRSGGLSARGAADLSDLARWVELLRYGGTSVQLPDADEIRARSARIRGELFESLSSSDRRKVTWWPASGRLAVVDGWNALSSAVAETSQRWGNRMRALLRRRPRGVAPSAPQSGS